MAQGKRVALFPHAQEGFRQALARPFVRHDEGIGGELLAPRQKVADRLEREVQQPEPRTEDEQRAVGRRSGEPEGPIERLEPQA